MHLCASYGICSWQRIFLKTNGTFSTGVYLVDSWSRGREEQSKKVVVAEWLRRWTRNPLGSARAGSNPADYVFFSSH